MIDIKTFKVLSNTQVRFYNFINQQNIESHRASWRPVLYIKADSISSTKVGNYAQYEPC